MNYIPFALLLLTSCTVSYSINNVQSKGVATEMVDENQDAKSDIAPSLDLSIPE